MGRIAVRIGIGVALGIGFVPAAGPVRLAAQDTDLIVRKLDFEGNHSIDDQSLKAAIATTKSSDFATFPLVSWMGLGEKRRFNERDFRIDAARIRLFYQLSGFLDAQVDTLVRRTDENVYITFRIHEGQPVRITKFSIEGLDSLPDRADVVRDLPLGLGDPYNRYLVLATGDTIQSRLLDRGYPTATVYVGRREVDREAHSANLQLIVDPGRSARIGAIRVVGTNEVDSVFVRTLLTTRRGRTFRQSDLYRSQLNLYQSGLFRFASVTVDTLAFSIGDPLVPLLVQVDEGPMHRAQAGVGYGTNDCFRANVGWTARNVGGNGRVFDVSARLSKIGVAGFPLGLHAERSWVCGSLDRDTIGSREPNFGTTVSFRRPAFLSPSNALTASAFAERRSEYLVYQREDIGASLTFNRETFKRIPFVLTYRVSYGSTKADPASFCSVFNACIASDIQELERRRVLATLTASISRARVNSVIDPSRGSIYSAEVTHSSRFIGSSRLAQFTRVVGDGSWYRALGSEVVLATHLRGGLIFSPGVELGGASGNFVPPEQRFYAGGANDVRGYDRNELGPVVYVVSSDLANGGDPNRNDVRVAPIGGNTVVVGNVELRLPSPVLPGRLRWAAFVDAGGVWARGTTVPSTRAIRVTPGLGLRLATPLGPARLDVAYNGYDLPRGTLYVLDAATGDLTALRDDYRRPGSTTGLNLQISVGQAF